MTDHFREDEHDSIEKTHDVLVRPDNEPTGIVMRELIEDTKQLNVQHSSSPTKVESSRCSNCSVGLAEYCNMPCGCQVFCKKCAMKMATGGKCRKCSSYFTAMKAIIR